MRWRIFFLVCALFPSLARAQDPVQVKLSYDAKGRGGGRKELKVLLQPVAGIKLPELKAAQPLYAAVDFADGRRMIVIDRADKAGKYTRVIADTNGDGDLTNDAPLTAEPMSFRGVYMVNISKVPFDIKQGGRTAKAALAVSLMVVSDGNADPTSDTLDNFTVSLSASGVYGGSFKLGGRAYKLTVSDGNVDGLPGSFVNRPAHREYGEREIIDPDADQIHIVDAARREEYDLPLCRRLVLGGKMYNLAFDAAADTLTFTPQADKGLVPLEIGNGIDHLALVNEDGSDSIAMIEPREKESVPAGRWRSALYAAERKDDKGFGWIVFTISTRSTPFVEASKEGARLALAESFTPQAVFDAELLSGEKKPGGQVGFGFVLIGNNQEIVRANMFRPAKLGLVDALSGGGWKQSPPPKFEITTADGKKVTSGSFQYG